MPLADILKALVGAGQPQPGQPQAPGTVTSQDIYTPGVESLLSAVPALVGSYEQGRGRPIGNVLSTLGNFGLTNAANRQKQHQDEGDIAARIESLASRGLAPPQGTLDAVNQMSPEAADKELSDVESQQVAQQQRQQARQEKISDLQYKAPVYPGNQKEAFIRDATGQLVRAPQYDKPAGAQVKTEMQLHESDPKAWNKYMADKAHYSVSTANTKTLDKAQTLLNFKLGSTPLGMIPELKNSVLIDRNTLRPVTGITAKQAFDNPDKYAFVDRKTGTETIPGLAAARNDAITLAQYSAKVLPGTSGKPLADWANTYANQWKIRVKAPYSVNEAMFGAARTSLAMQMQKALTGSTRPVNLVEFTRLTGDDAAGPLSAKDIDAVIPTSRDTREVAQAKLNVIQQLFDNKLQELNMNSGAPGYYAKSVNDAMSAAAMAPESPEAPEAAAPADTTTSDDGGSDL